MYHLSGVLDLLFRHLHVIISDVFDNLILYLPFDFELLFSDLFLAQNEIFLIVFLVIFLFIIDSI